MPRPFIAALAGLLGILAYVWLVVILGDRVVGTHWLLEFGFFALAGVVWVAPVWALMRWGASRR